MEFFKSKKATVGTKVGAGEDLNDIKNREEKKGGKDEK